MPANMYDLRYIKANYSNAVDSQLVIVHNNQKKDKLRVVKIRLRRVGAPKKPSYRLVIADARSPRNGAFINTIGHYNPLTDPETVVIDEEHALYWLKNGAQPTDTATRLLTKVGIMEKFKAAKEKT